MARGSAGASPLWRALELSWWPSCLCHTVVPECGAVVPAFREACHARPLVPFPQKETEQHELELPTPSMDPMSLHNPLNENYISLQFIISRRPFVAAGGGAECSGKLSTVLGLLGSGREAITQH